jgi:putative transposase
VTDTPRLAPKPQKSKEERVPTKPKQQNFFNQKFSQHVPQHFKQNHYLRHGGILRQKRKGRGLRPLSTKDPLHLVFKINRHRLKSRSLRTPRTYSLLQQLIKKYANHFFVKVEQVSIQGDHCHLLIRAPKRSQYQHFFRVVAGQLAQGLLLQGLLSVTDTTPRKQKGTGLWKLRPFTRVVKGFKAYTIVRNYIQLNEKEALGHIKYRKERLRGLSSSNWVLMWS